MATLHMSEAEVARDLHAVLGKVRQGVEDHHRAGPPARRGHPGAASQRAAHRGILGDAKQRSSNVTLDEASAMISNGSLLLTSNKNGFGNPLAPPANLGRRWQDTLLD